MTLAHDFPVWAAILVAFFVLGGSAITLVGSLGLLRLGTFYARTHAPTLGATMGMGTILCGSALYFSVLETRPVVHEVLIAVFITLTTPVTLMLLARAALYRDRAEGSPDVPAAERMEEAPQRPESAENRSEHEEPAR
ncbi:monovalent cation/H(+) antiporter subunit G [Microvirga pudoricolor]|uniref:monovalent cation/H(+) antiporter subunit G n=1 Tax=Microvirga pudoricolor TaxID=2778729 RepID=UPI00194EFCA9|nr:monovalent cation/H(+) antiporter subunit G [Microvirga pudoricolor]MBM6594369.1 cation:proton antiporter [Microvirga pudoricolor]